MIFARIVDAKSPSPPSIRSASRGWPASAERLGVSAENCEKLEIAGLLHDLGKLRVPDEILDKPGRLDNRERKIINTHSYETFQILRNIHGFEEITRWAAYHHEEPDGSGYPFHLKADAMPLEARILRVADIFQAMVQIRPYRQGLSDAEVTTFMRDLLPPDAWMPASSMYCWPSCRAPGTPPARRLPPCRKTRPRGWQGRSGWRLHRPRREPLGDIARHALGELLFAHEHLAQLVAAQKFGSVLAVRAQHRFDFRVELAGDVHHLAAGQGVGGGDDQHRRAGDGPGRGRWGRRRRR